jgi:crotonobetaine/carnitine-CoA ligase
MGVRSCGASHRHAERRTTMDVSDESIPHLLQRNMQRWPDRVMATFDTGESWTWAQAFDIGSAAAQELRSRGLGEHSHIGVLLPNGSDWFRAWFGISLLGGTMVPFLPAHRGAVLSDMVRRSDCKAVITTPKLRPNVDVASADLQVLTTDILHQASDRSANGIALPESRGWDLHALLFTSGTTGPSKAVEVTHHFLLHASDWWSSDAVGINLGEDDAFLCDLPLAHMAALAQCLQMVKLGGRIDVRLRPDLRDYWSTARTAGSTFAILLSTMAEVVRSDPPSKQDRGHRLRAILGVPPIRDTPEFMERFGIDHVVTAYGSTETGMPILRTAGWDLPERSCGRPLPGVEARIVDPHDVELPPNTPGELLLRRSRPWEQTVGYYGDDGATSAFMRNGWLHTGDILSVDADGNLFFHDRGKDYVRRRGENVSTFEVDREALTHPAIVEAACVGIEDGEGNEEIKIFLVRAPGLSVTASEILEFLVTRMAHFMVPRFYEFVSELPRTDTGRVKKFELRSTPHSDMTWDLVAAGYRVTRAGLRWPTGSAKAP